MLDFIAQNWMTLVTTISIPIAYIFGGKKKQKIELKHSDANALQAMQTVYDSFLDDYKTRMSEVMSEVSELKTHNQSLQKQFNEISLQYSKEVEISQNWEKLHRQLLEKYNKLEKEHDELKKDHDKLRKEFERVLKK